MSTSAPKYVMWLRGFPVVRDVPVMLAFIAAGLVVATGAFGEAANWLAVHLVALFGASHAILVWSRHFADTLLRLPSEAAAQRRQTRRLLAFDAAAVAVLAGVLMRNSWLVWMGAVCVAAVVAWHGVLIMRAMRRALLSRFASAVRFYLAAAGLLPVGAVIGALLTVDLGEAVHQRLLVAHLVTNLLGWIGLTVLGTLVSLWPTILRTRIADGAEPRSRVALRVGSVAIIVALLAVAADVRLLVAPAVLGYLVAALLIGYDLVRVAAVKRPAAYSALTVAAAYLWFIGALATVLLGTGAARDWEGVEEAFEGVALPMVVGFVAQIIVGALTYLVPVLLGGGPAAVRAHIDALERFPRTRTALVNGALLLALVPALRTPGLWVAGLALAAFVPLLALALVRWRA